MAIGLGRDRDGSQTQPGQLGLNEPHKLCLWQYGSKGTMFTGILRAILTPNDLTEAGSDASRWMLKITCLKVQPSPFCDQR